MNPLATKGGVGPIGNMMNVVNQVRQLQQNPNGMADFLKQRGIVNEQQYADIQKMCGNPAQVGQYLLQNGLMPQQQTMQAAQTIAPQVQKQL